MVGELSARSEGRSLTTDELKQVALVVGQGATAQRLKRTEGKDASVMYVAELTVDGKRAVEKAQQAEADAVEVLTKEKAIVERWQQVEPAKQRSRSQGMEL